MEKEIGRVTHYFSHLSVAALELTDTLQLGDTIHIQGHTTDFTQVVESMQIERQPVDKAGPGDDVAIAVKEYVRDHDKVFKVL
jgi:putative protease